ncbi:MAG: holo-ACP synthase [Planctomycetia bacterium]|nr:holo-ACP synthase [Planctomycetia bacterium]
MNIFGLGTDIIECSRIGKVIARHGDHFLQRIFTQHEIDYCHGKARATEHFAGRWAAKEAIFKSLGTGWRGDLQWTDFEIRRDDLGKPVVHVAGTSKDFLMEHRISNILISLSHCREYATATAIALTAE